MHNIDLVNTKLGMIFGFSGFLFKLVILGDASQTLLTSQNILESSVIAVICTLIGLAVTAVVGWLQRKWLGIVKKKKDDNTGKA